MAVVNNVYLFLVPHLLKILTVNILLAAKNRASYFLKEMLQMPFPRTDFQCLAILSFVNLQISLIFWESLNPILKS